MESPSPTRSTPLDVPERVLLDWDTDDVADFLSCLGFQAHTNLCYSAGIDGPALCYLGHDELKELQFNSIGRRLRLLRAVYDIKLRDGHDVSPEEWSPPSSGSHHGGNSSASCSADRAYLSNNGKVMAMEAELRDTKADLETLQLLVSTIAQASTDTNSLAQGWKNGKATLYKPSLQVDVQRAESKSRPESLTPTAAMPTGLVLPNTGLPAASTDKPRGYVEDDASGGSPPLSPYESPTPKSASLPQGRRDLSFSSVSDKGGRTPTALRGQADDSPAPSPKSPRSPRSKRPGFNRTASSKSSAHDTCLQLRLSKQVFVPWADCSTHAFGQKYNLKHVWSEYAMLISYGGNQKRALSYDERPRQVVHNLREEGETVSCLVQHQSELKSPLALASSRKAKLFKRYIASEGGRETSVTVPAQVLPNLISQGKTLPDDIMDRLPATAHFALCIYPYAAESEGERDLEFADCLHIVQKSDRYYDVKSTDDSGRTTQKRVPSTAVIECYTMPTSRVGGPKIIDPNVVAGIYVTAYALVDRMTTVQGEVSVCKGDKLRIYARCSHWSFVVKERANEFGWLPSWLLSSSNVTEASRREMVVHSPKRFRD